MFHAYRPQALDPYEGHDLPSFSLRSDDLADGDTMPLIHTADGGNISPHLSWEGFPEETAGFLVTCFDPDAPIPSGWWHWFITDIAEDCTELTQGVGASDLHLDGSAFHLRVDHGDHGYLGAAPPSGDRPHRYIFAVHALDVPTLEVDDDTTPAMCSFIALEHTIARATLTVTYQNV